MNLLFLHFSDIHFSSEVDYPTQKINEIAHTIPQENNFDLITLIVSGDLTNSAKATEYKNAAKMVKTLELELQKLCCNTSVLFVPGNHDIIIQENSQNDRSEKNATVKKDYYDELEKMDNFFSFAGDFNLFTCEYSHDIKIITIDNSFTIKFILLNSAPFSTREKNDKELHYLPDSAIVATEKDDGVNLCITIMHHGTQWFEDESKRRIEQTLLSNCDIFFIGHEHDVGSEKSQTENGRQLFTCRGGEFNASSFHESTFSTVLVDTSKMTITKNRLRWDRETSCYIENENFSDPFTLKNPHQFFPQRGFQDSLIKTSFTHEMNLKDCFVFPTLELGLKTDDETSQPIESENDFFSLLETYPCINIIGAKNSGKTALIKTLYSESIQRGLSPIFLDRNDRGKALHFLLSNLIREQYGDSDSAKSKFDQVPKKKKIIFIDDFDQQNRGKSNDEQFIQGLLKSIGHVVFTSTQEIDTNIIEGIKRELNHDDAVTIYKIREFYKSKRDALIEKICLYKQANESDIEEIISVIDKSVHSHRKLFALNPLFVIEATQFYLSSNSSARSSVAPFSKIFEANLIKQLERARKKAPYGKTLEGGVAEALVLLGEIAYFLHKNKKDRIKISELEKLMKDYDDTYDLDIELGPLIDFIKEANIMILCTTGIELEFKSETIHAYFVARKIEYLSKTNSEAFKEDLDYLLKNVCFSINENIILFLSYFFDTHNFADMILSYADEILSTFEMLSFDSNESKILSWGANANIKMISGKEQDRTKAVISEQERAISRKENAEILEYKGIYDYNEDERLSNSNKSICALKYLEMAGKSLIIHHATIPKIQKEQIVQKLYELPNKILKSILSDVEQDFDNFLNELKKCDLENENKQAIIRDTLVKLSLALCLSVYDTCAFACSNQQTVRLFCYQDFQETTFRVQKLLMIENACDSEEFSKAAIKQIRSAKKNKNVREIICIRIITNKHLLTHPSIKRELRQRINDTIFGGVTMAETLQIQHKAQKNN